MPPSPPPSRPFPWNKAALGAAIALTLILADQRIRFTAEHTSDIFTWDQWDIYKPMFAGGNWWKIFDYQHGPHRQGVGYLFTAALAHFTHWDARGDALLTVIVTAIAALVALALARKCGAHDGPALAVVPVVFLTMRQFEAWIGPANPSHGAFPVLLMMLHGLTWFMRSATWRRVVQVVLILFMIFTGFALFAGALAPLLFGFELWHARSNGDGRSVRALAIALLLCVGFWVMFFVGYKNEPAVPNFRFPYEHPWEYGGFAALMLASYAGWQAHLWLDFAGGLLLLLLVAFLAFVHGRRLLRAGPAAQPASAVIFLLAAFTVLYCLNTAVGRVMLGWRTAPYAPRYVTLLIPAFFAFYLQAELLPGRMWRYGALAVLAFVTAYAGLFLTPEEKSAVAWYSGNRAKWRDVYLETGSQQKADAATSPDQGYVIYPADLTPRLQYLREHHLNLFKSGRHEP
ncbi:MAG TPA: DUF6057 family protein [Lacunisphaera sp.]|nr:DUF6057 family protein [Lacunisphaera sp.]